MNKRLYCFAATAVVLLIAAVVATILFVPHQQSLVLSDKSTGRVYGKYCISDGENFSVTFVHSVNKTPVTDVYEIRNGEIWLTGTVYYSFGAGVPDVIDDKQILTIRDDGAMVITGMDRNLDGVVYAVGTVSDHILEIGENEVSLRNLCGRNSKVLFEIRN